MNSKNRIIVGISDAKMSKQQNDVIVTHSLGSCIGVCLYDKKIQLAAMLHFQLPESKLDAEKAISHPFMFADTGLKLLMQSMMSSGCNKHSMSVKIAGGASMRNGPSNFNIGQRNYQAIRKCLWRAGVMIEAEDVGGDFPRSLFMSVDTGQVLMKTVQTSKEL